MLYALGFGDQLVAVTHECDYPPEARSKPRVVRNRLPTDQLPSRAIDQEVSRSLGRGESLYEIDAELLEAARPDLLVTQELCDVCAVTGTDLQRTLEELALKPRIVTQTPRDLEGILEDILLLGRVLEAPRRAENVVAALRSRMETLRSATEGQAPLRAYSMEWLDPPYAAGHWVPEQVRLAGGWEALGLAGQASRRIGWEEIVQADPEVVFLMPCGFGVERTLEESRGLLAVPEWRKLSGVRRGRVYAVDANAYFSRPGPRVIEGAELLAHLFYPDRIPWKGASSAYAVVRY